MIITALGRWIIVAVGGVAVLAVTTCMGMLWVCRRVAQVAAEDEVALIASFKPSVRPPPGDVGQVLLDNGGEAPGMTYARHDRPSAGIGPTTSCRSRARSAGGGRTRSRGTRVEDISDEEIAAELARMMTGDDRGRGRRDCGALRDVTLPPVKSRRPPRSLRISIRDVFDAEAVLA